MNLICGALKNLWNEFYTNCVVNLDDRTKATVGFAFVIASIFVFILSTKGAGKGEMIGSWFLFWISMALFIAALFYLVFA